MTGNVGQLWCAAGEDGGGGTVIHQPRVSQRRWRPPAPARLCPAKINKKFKPHCRPAVQLGDPQDRNKMVSYLTLVLAGLWTGLIISEPNNFTIWALMVMNLAHALNAWKICFGWVGPANHWENKSTKNVSANKFQSRLRSRCGVSRPWPGRRQSRRTNYATRNPRPDKTSPKAGQPSNPTRSATVPSVNRSDFSPSSPNFMRKGGSAYIVCCVCGEIFHRQDSYADKNQILSISQLAACDSCYQAHFSGEGDTDGEAVQDKGCLIISDCRNSFRICFCRTGLISGCACSSLKGTEPPCSWCMPWLNIDDNQSVFAHRMLIGFLKLSQRRDYWITNWLEAENNKLNKESLQLPHSRRSAGKKPSRAPAPSSTQSPSNSSLFLANRADDIYTID